ncbi:MAG: 4-hydroxybenzoate polyprenyltransferase [Saprospiraceae bacterium]|jgi:4-hydroxybenzoate polyprenyltransferase
MVKYFSFLRWKNLVIIAAMTFSLKYWIFESLIASTGFIQFPSNFSFLQTSLLTLSIMLIAAGGYVINDINDTIADRINKHGKTLLLDVLSDKQAHVLYLSLTCLGIGIGGYLATGLHFYQLIFFHLIASALLWIYSSYFKSSVLIGNIIVAFLCALVPIWYFSFEALSYIESYGEILEAEFHSYFIIGPLLGFWLFTLTLTIFAFIYTLIREIVKDLEDLEGDKKLDGDTLPLAIGSKNTLWIVRLLLIAVQASLLYLYYAKLQGPPFDSFIFHSYMYVTIIFPSTYIVWLTFKNEVDYEKCSRILKIIMLFGIISSYLFYTFH